MRDDTVVTGHDGNGNEPAGVAGWSVPGYTELKALGSGGSGDVVLARHDASGTRVAIKYLRRKLLADPQWAGLFRAEAQVLAFLDDPNIVRLYEYIESPCGAAIVMELVDGVSVREILTHQGQTTPEAALVVLQGSLLGLAVAHRRGVVHRDYKPENVLVDGNGDSKLTDFGIAARTGEEPVAGGSLMYAPPEQFAGTPASPAGDVYAATATFYECLTGRPPFTGDTVERLLYQHLTEPVPLDPVPEPLRPLVAAGMAKEPEDRPADATTFVTALNAIASRAYGPDWAERGRSHLGEVALLLAALWPSGAPAAVHGSAVERVNLSRNAQESRESRHLWHVRHFRHLLHLRNRRGLRLNPIKAAVATGAAVAVVAAGTALAAGLTRHGSTPPAMLPAVTGVSPAGGTTMGGTTVTITGTGLAGATLVTFGGVAGRITADSATKITVDSPPITGTVGVIVTTAAITADSGTRITGTSRPGTGTVDITVTTPAGTSKPAAADHFTYTAPRAVTGVSPDSGSTAGGTTVSITGTGLAGATEVTFGGVAGRITAGSNTQVTVISPPGKGTVTVTVSTPAGASKTTAADQYTYTARPKQTQSISFTAPASATAGDSATLSATGGSSGLPVLFSVDHASGPGVCSVSGRTVTFALAGPCVIDANQAGNGTYAAAPQAQQTITVNRGQKQTQSITFNRPASGAVGGSATLSATASSGLPVLFSVDHGSGPGVCTLSGSTVTYTAAGSCIIDANQVGNGTYAAAPQARQTITVTGKPQSITFNKPPSYGYVGSSATLSATASSGLPVTFSVDHGSGPGVCTLSGSTVTYTAAGSCIIDANQAGNGTYAAAPQARQTITVTGKPQSITFNKPPSYGYVGSSATLSATASSGLPVVFSVDLHSGVDPTTGKPVCTLSGSTVTYAFTGVCIIDANQAGNGTYAAAPQAQLTIKVVLPTPG
jgi:eukaryotic-like serine/threonine-protein kinase